ncbi:hypothetical protein Tco_0174312 [Tanacetum coccineum]
MANNRTKPTTKEFAANDQANYYSGITSIKVNGKNAYELKGKFLDDLHNNAFSETNGEDAVEHIKYFLRIVDPIDLPNVNQDKLRVLVFPISLDHKWYDELTDGKLKEETLTHKARIKESWGYATPGVNDHEKAPFVRWENYGQGPYANTKTKKDYDPYLDNNRDTQDTKKGRHDLSTFTIRRFEMVKYSFRDDEEYVAIKENEYDDLTNTSKEAIHTYQEIFRMMDEKDEDFRTWLGISIRDHNNEYYGFRWSNLFKLIKRENKGIVITQSHYIEKILKKFNREDCSPVSTPMDPVEKLKPNTGKPVDQLEYSRAIGCLMYAMTSTRPDIAYAVGRLSRFTSNPSRQHWKAITRVFKYLRGTKDYGLSYVGYPSVLEGYSDASWINHVEDSSSTSGWVFLLGGGAISWASKKQTCITGSTMESEFVALAAAGKEAEWLRNLIHEIPIWPKPIAPISIRCDSAPTMARAYSQIYNGKSRHLGVRHSMVRELIRNGVISIEFVRTQHNLADHLTKGLARDLVNKSVIGMGLKSI